MALRCPCSGKVNLQHLCLIDYNVGREEKHMTRISDENRRKIVHAHIQDGRTITRLVAEYGISRATVSNWGRSHREECQNNDEEKSQLEMM